MSRFQKNCKLSYTRCGFRSRNANAKTVGSTCLKWCVLAHFVGMWLFGATCRSCDAPLIYRKRLNLVSFDQILSLIVRFGCAKLKSTIAFSACFFCSNLLFKVVLLSFETTYRPRSKYFIIWKSSILKSFQEPWLCCVIFDAYMKVALRTVWNNL